MFAVKRARPTENENLVNRFLNLSANQQAYADLPERSELSEQAMPAAEPNAATLLAELRATCDRLFATFDGQATSTKPTAPAADAIDAARPAESLGAAGLKRMLQLRARRRRKPVGQFFDWPAWDMLLDLAAVRAEGGHVSVSSVCISSGAPQSTALRKLAALENAKLVRRYFHGSDRRRVCIALTDEAADMVISALQEELAFYQTISTGR
jgi:DNA-binding transcriptional ArsR family regulator